MIEITRTNASQNKTSLQFINIDYIIHVRECEDGHVLIRTTGEYIYTDCKLNQVMAAIKDIKSGASPFVVKVTDYSEGESK